MGIRTRLAASVAAIGCAVALAACGGVPDETVDAYQSAYAAAQSGETGLAAAIADAEKLLADSKDKVQDGKTREALTASIAAAKKTAGAALPDNIQSGDDAGKLKAEDYEAAQSGLVELVGSATAAIADLKAKCEAVDASWLAKSKGAYDKAVKSLADAVAAGEGKLGESADAVDDNASRDALDKALRSARAALDSAKKAEVTSPDALDKAVADCGKQAKVVTDCAGAVDQAMQARADRIAEEERQAAEAAAAEEAARAAASGDTCTALMAMSEYDRMRKGHEFLINLRGRDVSAPSFMSFEQSIVRWCSQPGHENDSMQDVANANVAGLNGSS